jgi:hypothetical protein
MKFSFVDNSKPSRRRILRDAFTLAVAASPLASLAKAATETKATDPNADEVTFAAGPRPLVQYPQKRPLTLVTTRNDCFCIAPGTTKPGPGSAGDLMVSCSVA